MLSGPLPPEFGDMDALIWLHVQNNPDISGPLPHELTSLTELEELVAGGTGLCASTEPEFRAWLNDVVAKWRVPSCGAEGHAEAYLTQATQSREYPVPLGGRRERAAARLRHVRGGDDREHPAGPGHVLRGRGGGAHGGHPRRLVRDSDGSSGGRTRPLGQRRDPGRGDSGRASRWSWRSTPTGPSMRRSAWRSASPPKGRASGGGEGGAPVVPDPGPVRLDRGQQPGGRGVRRRRPRRTTTSSLSSTPCSRSASSRSRNTRA